MNEFFFKKNFNTFYFIVCALVFVLICLRAFFIPFSHDETSTFFFYIQSGQYLPYKSHAYTNNHVLNSALANICYHIAGSHRFVLRIPNLLAFIVLCFGVFRFFRYLNKPASKIILVTFFVITLGFLDIFELCRGYGLSMGFIIFGLSFLQDYFTTKKFWYYLVFSFFWQLALAANLTLVMLSLLFLIFVFVFQIRNKLFFEIKNLVLLALHLKIIYSWIKFSFFYKKNGMLDSGWGEDYWVVSFKSLILFIFGADALWLQILVIALFSIVLLYGLYCFFRAFSFMSVYKPQFFYLVILCILILGFYLQKKLLDINYPEDRTGLFFYIFFALSVVFFFESIPKNTASVFAFPFLASSLVYFCVYYDLKTFTHYFYHVVPKEIYSYLEQEHQKNQQLFTLGGNPDREMNYTFLNYRAGGLLNPMDEPRQMHMNCDYYFALMAEKPFYRFFYDEVAYDMPRLRVLLKRKQPIKRIDQLHLAASLKTCKGSDEFFEFLRFNDSALKTRNCIEADIELSLKNVPKPFRAFIVLQIVDMDGKNICYKKVALNWIADDLNGQTKRFKLTSGPLPEKFKECIVYVWNIDKKLCEFDMNKLRIYDLKAPGINIVIPKNYYPYVKEIVKKEQL